MLTDLETPESVSFALRDDRRHSHADLVIRLRDGEVRLRAVELYDDETAALRLHDIRTYQVYDVDAQDSSHWFSRIIFCKWKRLGSIQDQYESILSYAALRAARTRYAPNGLRRFLSRTQILQTVDSRSDFVPCTERALLHFIPSGTRTLIYKPPEPSSYTDRFIEDYEEFPGYIREHHAAVARSYSWELIQRDIGVIIVNCRCIRDGSCSALTHEPAFFIEERGKKYYYAACDYYRVTVSFKAAPFPGHANIYEDAVVLPTHAEGYYRAIPRDPEAPNARDRYWRVTRHVLYKMLYTPSVISTFPKAAQQLLHSYDEWARKHDDRLRATSPPHEFSLSEPEPYWQAAPTRAVESLSEDQKRRSPILHPERYGDSIRQHPVNEANVREAIRELNTRLLSERQRNASSRRKRKRERS